MKIQMFIHIFKNLLKYINCSILQEKFTQHKFSLKKKKRNEKMKL